MKLKYTHTHTSFEFIVFYIDEYFMCIKNEISLIIYYINHLLYTLIDMKFNYIYPISKMHVKCQQICNRFTQKLLVN